MPFKSEAQRRKFGAMVNEGKISKSTFHEWNDATPNENLPERIGKPKMRSVEDLRAHYKKRFGG